MYLQIIATISNGKSISETWVLDSEIQSRDDVSHRRRYERTPASGALFIIVTLQN